MTHGQSAYSCGFVALSGTGSVLVRRPGGGTRATGALSSGGVEGTVGCVFSIWIALAWFVTVQGASGYRQHIALSNDRAEIAAGVVQVGVPRLPITHSPGPPPNRI